MTEKKKNNKSWIVTATLAGGALGYVFLVFLPGQHAIARLREELTAKQTFIIETDKITKSIVDAEKKLEDVDTYIKNWQEQSPAEADLAEWFGSVHQHVDESGVTVRRFEPEKIERLDDVWKMPLVVGVSGSFAQVAQMLARLEGMKGTVWLDEVTITPTKEGAKKLQVELTLALFADNQEDSD